MGCTVMGKSRIVCLPGEGKKVSDFVPQQHFSACTLIHTNSPRHLCPKLQTCVKVLYVMDL